MKTPRQIAVADHLWETFERIAEEMGSDPEALVNQAMYAFARQNGFVVPGAPSERPPEPSGSEAQEGAERQAVAERVLETAARLERDMHDLTPPDVIAPPPLPASEPDARALFLQREDGSEAEVAKDRYVIGRGRHCDLVIDGGKVSREHAVVFRRPDGRWFIEDLGSSNGTWFHQERIGRRPIDDGDEYFICAERLRCALR